MNQGDLTSSYARIEKYTFDKKTGNCYATVALYPSYQDAQDSVPPYLTGFSNQGNYFSPSDPNYSGSKIIATLINYSGSQFEYPNFLFLPCTASVVIDQPIYETQIVTQSVPYFDFDETGSMIEKTKIEYVSQSVQIGTQPVTKYYSNLDSITGSFYTFMYDGVKNIYGSIFGNENITDV